ncbi:MAG: serine protease [Verrucomicrobiota bacterium]|nr:serine protease [Verrucomicrobiota bacterium]
MPAQPPAPAAPPPKVGAKPDEKSSVVRVNVTNQPWDFLRPWGKRPPFSRRAIGAVLPGERVLVTAEFVANASYLEFEAPAGGSKVPAKVEIVDYEANLALLRAEDDAWLKPYQALELTSATVGDNLSIWQLENTGTLLVTNGPMTSVEVARYSVEESALLVYRLTASLQFRDSSFALPVVKDGKLVGIVMRYDNNSKNTELVPAPVIEHFLKDAEQPPYDGFPRAGMTFANTRDPQFRRYIGLDAQTPGGVYVTEVQKDGAADKAGVQKGDIIVSIAGEAIDQDGNYLDPVYGKIVLSHLLSTRHFANDTVTVTLFRKGQKKNLPLTITRRPPEDYVIEPYVFDRPPKFFLLGGLVFQELSRQYLKEFGAEWLKRAPGELVYLDRYQSELFPEGKRKIVILSRVLPSEVTVGYEQLRSLVVTEINDVPLQRLADIPSALEKVRDGVHKIEFESEPTLLFIDAEDAAAVGPMLKASYRLPALFRLD